MPKYDTPEQEAEWQEAYSEFKFALSDFLHGEGDPVARRVRFETALPRFQWALKREMVRLHHAIETDTWR